MNGSFSRTALLIGDAGLQRLAAARVLVAGVGGVGSYAVEALVRAGVGTLTLIDSDTVQTSNINRQLHALTTTLGRAKVEVMAERLLQINPGLRVTPLQELITPDNVPVLLVPGYDLVLDAIDTLSAKLALLQNCLERQIPVISSMGAAGKLDPTRIKISDIADSQGCRLARKLRKELRRGGIASGVTVVYSDEPCSLERLGEPEAEGERRPLGTISYLPAAFGLFMASEAIKRLLQG
ncbi:MAG: tRNA threonylcarbamoyladenosine dehydratase [Trichlorobacter sp.]|uniref:tRNA threonylcarbamoyladenosine dehydratase n=1 Tax=Trichlorobacter sp. TaxID=2911007 RepID=UPI00255F47D5|nr:tRNA threonylcarbamoyladenosine dehydratase [Trichlorobacter sp.]MDK9718614.1 tRNA threonylcarbamoyladenosine dehydratase [Trichlorobacter sp.]